MNEGITFENIKELRKKIQGLEIFLKSKGYKSKDKKVSKFSKEAVTFLGDVDYELIKIGRIIGNKDYERENKT